MRAIVAAVAAAGLLLAGCGGPAAPAAPSSPASTGSARAATAGAPGRPAAPSRAASAGCSGAQPAQAVTGLEPGGLTGVQFVSPARGWAVGADAILGTSDGGAHWIVQDRGRLQLTSVDFISDQRGWAVGTGSLLATSDGGRHWTALPERCPLIRAVHFVSPSAGFAVAGGTGIILYGGWAPETGGVVLATGDGGRSWHRLAAPASAQSVCFNDPRSGWLGAGGRLYRTADGGRSWALAAGPGPFRPGYPSTMVVQCAGAGSAWALDIGPGAAASQMPHIGYHAGPAGAVPIFAEQYFPHPGVVVSAPSPSAYPGALSGLSASAAVYVDYCPACGYGTGPWDLVTGAGAVLTRRGNVGGLNQPVAASFLTPELGWVAGTYLDNRDPSRPERYWRVVSTSDGGRTWRVDYAARGG
jgi:Photosynthesis system II assembly factor YCF48